MKKTGALLLKFLILSRLTMNAQDSIPLLSGKLVLSVEKGTFNCDFTLSNIPRIEDYFIRLNSGMNILSFKNLDAGNLIYYDKSFADTLSYGETSAYFFPDNTGKGKFLPRSIQFKYTGMYPVVKDTLHDYSVQDWKGNIAFNGYSVRTDGTQSAWYPILYDIKKDLKYDKVKYNIEISCEDCNTIYVNGSLPAKGPTARLVCDTPQQLTMFSGKYRVANVKGTYLLNPDISDEQISRFGEITNSYKKFFETHLQIPYKQAITYIQTTPTSKNNAWLFVSYPTIVNIGYGDYGLKGFFDKKQGDWFKPYIAHELGHYYFGTVKVFNAALGDMMSEGFAEYLSLELTGALVSDSLYNKKINEKIDALSAFKVIPFAKVRTRDDYQNRELYVYYYAPLVFSAIRKEIGEKNMWSWLTTILKQPALYTDYAFLEQTLQSVLKDNSKTALIKSKYFDGDQTMENVKHALGNK